MSTSFKFLVVNMAAAVMLMLIAALIAPVMLTPRVYLSAGGFLIFVNMVAGGIFSSDFADSGGWADSCAQSAYVPPDPWEMQRRVMVISGQEIKDSPRLTTTSALYGALIMEESGEFYGNLSDAVGALVLSMPESERHRETFANISRRLQAMSAISRTNAEVIRGFLSDLPPFDFPLSEDLAVALLDDTTDITVVNCGFAIAAGLPGADGYTEVTRSNLSKANPETGAIDKDPSGKWIKGVNYFQPNLAQVLRAHEPERPMSEDELRMSKDYVAHHPA